MAVDCNSEEESDQEEDEENSDSDSDSDSEPESVVTPPTQEIPQESHFVAAAAAAAAAPKANFTLEELSDFDPMDQDRTGTIAPSGFSSPASARSHWTPLDPDAVGSSARRLRRRVGDRRSFIHLQFQDPPPPRIDELDEPESEVEGTFIFCDSGTLAQELPYYSIEIMEYSTPSP
ncbi:uncharacterized protein ColSpa_03535 [Colletotrichum spaethianum]|uniref:Uncharacterized protein n=1 Tax=Colletotrichum spaethianum TaxID=700344 RepID=A0AA37P7D6_9PEZI|nr:uncharacterized protein ColSpa_03535 [Colletotrichum spaethianum]GKT43354.1 hypothetical protein ColSpa_03535 [Colletotrichum spaethianum]